MNTQSRKNLCVSIQGVMDIVSYTITENYIDYQSFIIHDPREFACRHVLTFLLLLNFFI